MVLAVAVDAIGADNVRAVMMPTRYTADISQIDAADMARRLGVRCDDIAIGPAVDAFEGLLAGQFAGLPVDATEENIQARVRGTLLMALSNKTGRLVLTTQQVRDDHRLLHAVRRHGRRLRRHQDVPKTLVYRLAVWRNRDGEVIPERIITRPPSAELRPDQTDQDSLPPYDVLDGIMERYMEHNESAGEIVAAGYPPGRWSRSCASSASMSTSAARRRPTAHHAARVRPGLALSCHQRIPRSHRQIGAASARPRPAFHADRKPGQAK